MSLHAMRPNRELHDAEDTTAGSWAGGAAVTAGILLALAVAQSAI
jgi:hypothetical protein